MSINATLTKLQKVYDDPAGDVMWRAAVARCMYLIKESDNTGQPDEMPLITNTEEEEIKSIVLSAIKQSVPVEDVGDIIDHAYERLRPYLQLPNHEAKEPDDRSLAFEAWWSRLTRPNPGFCLPTRSDEGWAKAGWDAAMAIKREEDAVPQIPPMKISVVTFDEVEGFQVTSLEAETRPYSEPKQSVEKTDADPLPCPFCGEIDIVNLEAVLSG